MPSLTKEQIYVAELRVPSYFYSRRERRGAIPNPSGFGINKAYWVVRPPDEQPTANEYPELIFIIEFVSKTLKEAEDHALKVGRIFNSIVSAYGGFPFKKPYIYRIASIDLRGCLISQHNYWYTSELLSGFDQTVEHQLQKYFMCASAIDGEKRHRLQSAIHWYGIAIGADEPTISYVAAWTGLESVGEIIDCIAHPNGSRDVCNICPNRPGRRGERSTPGINHSFNFVSKEFLHQSLSHEAKELLTKDLAEFSFEEARTLRNAVVHGRPGLDALVQKCSVHKRHLFHVLNASIQTTLNSSAKSWIPGYYEFHPHGRSSFKFKKGLRKSPYHDEWIEGFRYKTQPSVPDKERVDSSVVSVEWESNPNIADFIEAKCAENFIRDAEVYDFSEESIMSGLTTWDHRRAEPLWEEVSASHWVLERTDSEEVTFSL